MGLGDWWRRVFTGGAPEPAATPPPPSAPSPRRPASPEPVPVQTGEGFGSFRLGLTTADEVLAVHPSPPAAERSAEGRITALRYAGEPEPATACDFFFEDGVLCRLELHRGGEQWRLGGGVRIGASHLEARRLFGVPVETPAGPAGGPSLRFGTHGVDVHLDSLERIARIDLGPEDLGEAARLPSVFDGATGAEGLRFGEATLADVVALYGPDWDLESSEGQVEAVTLRRVGGAADVVRPQGIRFERNRVAGLSWASPSRLRAGPVRLGMRRSAVEAAWGPPGQTRDDGWASWSDGRRGRFELGDLVELALEPPLPPCAPASALVQGFDWTARVPGAIERVAPTESPAELFEKLRAAGFLRLASARKVAEYAAAPDFPRMLLSRSIGRALPLRFKLEDHKFSAGQWLEDRAKALARLGLPSVPPCDGGFWWDKGRETFAGAWMETPNRRFRCFDVRNPWELDTILGIATILCALLAGAGLAERTYWTGVLHVDGALLLLTPEQASLLERAPGFGGLNRPVCCHQAE